MKYVRMRDNGVGKAIQIIAIIVLCVFFILGFVVGKTIGHIFGSYGDSAPIVGCLIVWAMGIIPGFLLLGIAEIVFLLQEISNESNSISSACSAGYDKLNRLEDALSHRKSSTASNSAAAAAVICPVCHAGQSAGRATCYRCGAALTGKTDHSAAEKTNQSAGPQDQPAGAQKTYPVQPDLEGTVLCPVCGAKQMKERATCYRCGARFVIRNAPEGDGLTRESVEQKPAKKICSRCGKANDTSARFCVYCGNTL